DLLEMKKRGEPIVVLTAYDVLFARLVDEAGTDVILVGDSLAQVVLGLDSTLPVTLDDMIHHGRAVRRGVRHALLVVDMPFMTFQVSPEDTLRNAGRIMKETGAEAVKLEGGDEEAAEHVAKLVRAGIPVMGHIGLTPQSVHALGGFRVQGREEEHAERLRAEAKRLEMAGAFAVVLELVPGRLAGEISRSIGIPTIGIGAGPDCDGRLLALAAMLGWAGQLQPRFLRRFAAVGAAARQGIGDCVSAVRARDSPRPAHTFE